jgi:hypothetical protein
VLFIRVYYSPHQYCSQKTANLKLVVSIWLKFKREQAQGRIVIGFAFRASDQE